MNKLYEEKLKKIVGGAELSSMSDEQCRNRITSLMNELQAKLRELEEKKHARPDDPCVVELINRYSTMIRDVINARGMGTSKK